MFEPHFVIVVTVLTELLLHTLDLEVDFLIQIVPQAMHHRNQLGCQSELSLLHPESVADDWARKNDAVSAFNRICISLGIFFMLFADLPVGAKVVSSIPRNREHSSSAKKDIVRVNTIWQDEYMYPLDGLMSLSTLE